MHQRDPGVRKVPVSDCLLRVFLGGNSCNSFLPTSVWQQDWSVKEPKGYVPAVHERSMLWGSSVVVPPSSAPELNQPCFWAPYATLWLLKCVIDQIRTDLNLSSPHITSETKYCESPARWSQNSPDSSWAACDSLTAGLRSVFNQSRRGLIRSGSK